MALNHSNREYEAELLKLRHDILEMGGRIEEMIRDAVRSLIERDSDLARRTIAADNHVNRLEIDTDELCLRILARRQPMASDLRFISIAFKMVTDLERIGDLAVNVCERAIDLNAQPELKPYEDTQRMADIVREMVSAAIEAFINGDAERAAAIIERDDEVDELYHTIFRDILSLMLEDTNVVERGIHIQSTAKFLERIGDHATNLAEQVIFMAKGRDVRHEGKLPKG
ncbi:MAG: phosphate signaling complex protein PhoU [Deltaproteobacteria bacterium]|nr:phosphate signaling complex protein PhoU [Deltaproteobacteria bacterium]MCB9785223.1 phosphate signaling complex protein PhoU [Deltaproteobacteria bacterium]